MRRMTMGWLLLLLGLPLPLLAQNARGQITGVVTSDVGEPLTGVQVSVRGTTLSSVTGENGRYLIVNVPAGQHVLETSTLGFAAAEIAVNVTAGAPTVLDIRLEPRAIALETVVAIGYGTQRREQVTGAVASVSEEQFVAGPAKDAAALIAGKLPGLVTSTSSGDPRRETEIMLRGVTSVRGNRDPLILIDGVPGDLSSVAPEDIEAISVLKDGSAAAIYGTRGSNGVVLISTKRHEGTSPTLRYDGYISQSTIYRQPDFLTASDYRRLIAEGYKAEDGQTLQDLGHSTDWLGQVLREPVSYRHNLTLSGGATNTNYTAALNYEDTEGIFLRSDNQEVTGRANIRHAMFDGRLEAELNLQSRTRTFFGWANAGRPSFDYAWRQALIRNPTDRILDDNGNWQERGEYFYTNPLGLLLEENGEEERRNQRMHGTLTLRPIDQLRFSLMGGTTRESRLRGAATTFRHSANTQSNARGTAERETRSDYDRILEITGTYTDRLADHSFTLLGGYGYQDFLQEGFNASNREFPTDLFGFHQLGEGEALADGRASMDSYKEGHKLIGFFGRVNYDWKNRYLLMASVRHEGSSRFGTGHKWGTFPAVSAGWRISEEPFMKGIAPFVNDLRLRVGYGVTGIAPDSSYLSLTSYSYSTPRSFIFDGRWVNGLTPSRNPNPNLRWEEKQEVNIGVNFSLFDFRLNGALDVYRRDTRDMIYNYSVPSPPYLTSNLLANVGHMRNRGVEAELSYDVFDRSNLKWTTSVNGSTNRNTLMSLSDETFTTNECFFDGHTGEPIQQSTHRICVGGPVGDMYGFKSVDIDDNGVWVVLNKDGERISIEDATQDDRHVIGNGLPKYYLAWNNTAQLGRFDLSVNMRGAFDFQVLNFQRLYYENPTILQYNMLRSAFEPVYGKRTVNYDLAYVSYYVEDGDYWKLDNATLGYTLPTGALGRLASVLSGARVYVSGRNLLTITGYMGMDPEVRINSFSPGTDHRDTYPTIRTFTAGLTLSF